MNPHKRKHLVIAFSTILLAISLHVSAVEQVMKPIEISLADAIKRAIKESDDYRTKLNETLKLQHKYEEVKSGIYPKIDGAVTWQKNVKKIPDKVFNLGPLGSMAMPLQQDYEAKMGVTARQTLWSFGRLFTAIDLADSALKLSSLSEKATQNQIAYNAKMAYYSTLLAEKMVVIAKHSYDNAKKNKALLKKRFSFGRPPRADRVKLSLDVSARIPQLKKTQSQYQLSLNVLKVLLGIPNEQSIRLTSNLQDIFTKIALNGSLKKMNDTEPTLKVLQKSIKINNDIIKIKKANYLPVLAAFASWNYMGEGEKTTIGSDKMNQIGVVGINLIIPIWDGGERSGQLKQALVDKRNAKIALRKARKGFSLQLRNAISEHESLAEIYKSNIQIIKLAKQSYNQTKDQFKSGKTTTARLNDAELMLTGQMLQKELTVFNLNALMAKIEKLTSPYKGK